jgi:hypothetical protein
MKKFLFLAFLFLVALDMTYAQCAMCKQVVENASEEPDNSIGQQLNTGILYLMAIPYIILVVAFRKRIFTFLKELRTAGRN